MSRGVKVTKRNQRRNLKPDVPHVGMLYQEIFDAGKSIPNR